MDTKPSDHGSSQEQAPDLQSSPHESTDALDPESARLAGRIVALQLAGRKGANWFFWVAALSVVNSILMHVGAGIYFVVGMGVSLVADVAADGLAKQHPESGLIIRAVGIGFAILAAAVVVLFGWLANRRYLAAFVVGMGLYLLDGLIFLFFEDWLSVAFHAFALYWMGAGFLAYRALNAIEKKLKEQAAHPDGSSDHSDELPMDQA
jgi:hypothetical protein